MNLGKRTPNLLFFILNLALFLSISNVKLHAQDTDADGLADTIDLDDDNDGILDIDEGAYQFLDLGSAAITTSGATQTANNISIGDVTGSLQVTPVGGASINSFALGSMNTNEPVYSPKAGIENAFGISQAVANNSTTQRLEFVLTLDRPVYQLTMHFLGIDFSETEFTGAHTETLLSAGSEVIYNSANRIFTDVDPSSFNHLPRDGYGSILITAADGGPIQEVRWNSIDNPRIGPPFFDGDGYVLSFSGSFPLDTDGDGVYNHLDLDSDNDGCSDFVEGQASFSSTMGTVAGGTLTDGNGGIVATNLGNTVGSAIGVDLGVPTSASGGQAKGTSQFSTIESCTDSDADGLEDTVDLDDDNDGILDRDESENEVLDLSGASLSSSGILHTASNIRIGDATGTLALTAIGGAAINSFGVGSIDTNETVYTPMEGVIDAFGISQSMTNNSTTERVEFVLTLDRPVYQLTMHFLGIDFSETEFTGVHTETLLSAGTEVVYNPSNRIFTDVDPSTFNHAPRDGYGSILITAVDGGPIQEVRWNNIDNPRIGPPHFDGDGYSLSFTASFPLDIDGDGVYNHVDLDSDNDGCADFVEGDASFQPINGLPAGGTVTDGNGAVVTTNLGNSVNTSNGIPLSAGSGQNIGISQNASSENCADTDNDGIADTIDLDDDNDGITDIEECGRSLVAEASNTTLDIALGTGATSPPIISGGGSGLLPQEGSELIGFNNNGFFSGSLYLPLGTVTDAGTYSFSFSLGNYSNQPFATFATGLYTNGSSASAPGVEIGGQTKLLPSPALGSWENASLTVTVPPGSPLLGQSLGFYFEVPATGVGRNVAIDAFEFNSPTPFSYCSDADNDGIFDPLDLDSDNDGCPDFLEGGKNFVIADGQAAPVTLSDGNGGGVSTNLGTTIGTAVNTLGIPIVAGTGQDFGFSKNPAIENCTDTDNDGIADTIDLDDDNDGITDIEECGRSLVAEASNTTLDIALGTGATSPPIISGGGSGLLPQEGSELIGFNNNGFFSGSLYLPLGTVTDAGTYSFSFSLGNYSNQPFATFATGLYTNGSSASAPGVEIGGQTKLLPSPALGSWENASLTVTVPPGSPLLGQSLGFYFEVPATGVGRNVAIDAFEFNSPTPFSYCSDADNDGIFDPLDLDSDNDGCPDFLEGGKNFVIADGQAAPVTLSDGNGAQVTNNLGTPVGTSGNTLGIPTVAGTGQALGTSKNQVLENCNDIDNDGVPNIVDIDNDNDGITDVQECGRSLSAESTNTDINIALGNGASGPPVIGGGGSGLIAQEGSQIIAFSNDGSVSGSMYLPLGTVVQAGTYTFAFQLGNYNNQPLALYNTGLYTNGISAAFPGTEIAGQSKLLPNPALGSWENASLSITIPTASPLIGQSLGFYFEVPVTGARRNLAIDDFSFASTVLFSHCLDTDGDGIFNPLDIDADNDGIYDVVEGGDAALDSNGDGRIDVADSGFSDTNNNGMDDTAEDSVPIDTDGNGSLDAFAIDADGDGCLDVNEAGFTDANNDGQVDGSGVATSGSVNGSDGYSGTTLAVTDENLVAEDCDVCIDFANTATDPIVDFLLDRNNDTDPFNNIANDIAACVNDGKDFTNIFLCGPTDEVVFDLNLIGADSVRWQMLDEGSCSSAPSSCANTSSSCVWNDVGTGLNYTLNTAGSYRLLVKYVGGCSARFHFDAFRSDFDLTFNTENILCDEAGSIDVTGLGTNFAYRLVNATTNSIQLPFGTVTDGSFDITTAGTYRVEVTPLDGGGNLIPEACIYSTPQVEVLENFLVVSLTSEDEYCGEQGSIAVNASTNFSQYTYEIRLNDGSPAPSATDPNYYLGHPGGTLIQSELASPSPTYTIDLNADAYFVVTRTSTNCVDVQSIVINKIPDLTLNANKISDISCAHGEVALVASGGLVDYEFVLWSKNGVPLYTDAASIPNGDFQLGDRFGFSTGQAGDYVFLVRDSGGCTTLSNTVTIIDGGLMSLSANHTPSGCNGFPNNTLNVMVSAGVAPYEYSLDGGVTTQSNPNFSGLLAGTYTIGVTDATGCIETLTYTLTENDPLSTQLVILHDESCAPTGASVRFMNPRGGLPPYEYSFDGGGSFVTSATTSLPIGTFTGAIRDAVGCTVLIDFSVPPPPSHPVLAPILVYACDGTATLMVNNDRPAYDYTYTLDGVPNMPANSSTFTGLMAGTYTLETTYDPNAALTMNTIYEQDFGNGPTSASPEIGTGFCFEPQDGTVNGCGVNTGRALDEGEYALTAALTNPLPTWILPNDTSGGGTPRYLAINTDAATGSGTVVFQLQNLDIVPDEDMNISFDAFNLLGQAHAGNAVFFTILLRDPSGTVLTSVNTANLPKNTGPNDWHRQSVTLSPGNRTQIDLVVQVASTSFDGPDIALDNFEITQATTSCPDPLTNTVVVEPDRAFGASVQSTGDVSCNGLTDGTATIIVTNFDPAFGVEYSLDGGTTYLMATGSPFTTLPQFSGGTHTILVRRGDDTSCEISLSATIAEPASLIVMGSITAQPNCSGGLGSITASVTGGSPPFVYQLEDTSGTPITGFDFATNGGNSLFNGLGVADYLIRVRDGNGCTALLTAPLQIVIPNPVTFSAVPTACYSGLNDAQIVVTVTDGNANYQFRRNSGPWLDPDSSTPLSYTFTGLSDGTHLIEVRDGFGCSDVQGITIDPTLQVVSTIAPIGQCSDGQISISASGGQGTLVYALVPNGTTPAPSDFSATSSLPIAAGNEGTYDVYVRDNNGLTGFCEHMESLTIDPLVPLGISTNLVQPLCNGDFGQITATINTGLAPFTIEFIDLDHGGTANRTDTNVLSTNLSYLNLPAGNYTLRVTDALGCDETITPLTLVDPDALTADITFILPSACASTTPSDFGFQFVNYPSTLGTIEFSADGGLTWTGDNSVPGSTDRLVGHISGTTVFPSLRTVDGSGNTICQSDLPQEIIPFPLDDLDITIHTVVANCNELRVTVQGTQGIPNYEYAFTDNPAVFNPATAGWTPPTPGNHVWMGLIPGRTYVFYVRDASGCVRQSSINVNDITTNPMDITPASEPSCNGAADGEVTFAIFDTDGSVEPNMEWQFFDVDTGALVQSSGGSIPFSATVHITGLAAGNYYIVVTQLDAVGTPSCVSGSENLLIQELDPITASFGATQDIRCSTEGLITITGLTGGGGTYTFDIIGPTGFTAITGTSDNPIRIPANSPEGNYTVTINDQFGCTAALGNAFLNLTDDPTITSVDVDNCGAQNTVTVTATTPGSSLLYSLDGGSTYVNNGGVFTNVAAGTYTVSVQDDNGCSETTMVTVQPNLTANVSLSKTLDCSLSPNAIIEVDVLLGSGNYDVAIDGPAAHDRARAPITGTDLVWADAVVAGSYTVQVFDTNTSTPECSRSFTIIVPDVVNPVFNAMAEDISCFGASDGTITITTVDNGILPLGFALNPAVAAYDPANGGFQGLPPGTYEITATGNNGCAAVLSGIVIDGPSNIALPPVSITPFDCSNDEAEIRFDLSAVSGGSGSYPIIEFWNDQGTPTMADDVLEQRNSMANFTYLDHGGGSFLIRVYDSQGCFAETNATIPAFDALIAVNVVPVTPRNCTTETVRIEAQGGVTNSTIDPADYEFRLLPSGTFQTNPQFDDLLVGDYGFEVRNIHTGCTMTTFHSVQDLNTFAIAIDKLSDVQCFGTNTGSITIGITDAFYLGDIDWTIYDTQNTLGDTTDDSLVLNGLTLNNGPSSPIAVGGGTFRVVVSQVGSPQCTQEALVTILEPVAALDVVALEIQSAGCAADAGVVQIIPNGGYAPYSIEMTESTTGTLHTGVTGSDLVLSNISAGTYDITVRDASGCEIISNNALSLVQADPIVANLTATSLVCPGDSDASIMVNLAPRTNPVVANYQFRLNQYADDVGIVLLSESAFQAANGFSNLRAGFYSVTVVDDAGCAEETAIIEITDPPAVRAQLVQTRQQSCSQGAELELRVTEGHGPFEYLNDQTGTWLPLTMASGTVTRFPNADYALPMGSGSYQFQVRDVNSCTPFDTNTIMVQEVPDLRVTLLEKTDVNCHGEVAGRITVEALGGFGNYQFALYADMALSTLIAGPQNTGDFENLLAGTYYLNVTSNDCTLAPVELSIEEPTALILNATSSNISCLGANDGRIELALSGGGGGYEYAISPNLNQFSATDTFENLVPGTYTVIAQDANGCFEIREFTLSEPMDIDVIDTVAPETCLNFADGTVEIVISGGTAPYSTALDANNQTDFVLNQTFFNNLSAGPHVVFVQDANGCQRSHIIEIPAGVNLNASIEVNYGCDENIPTSTITVSLEDPDVASDVLYGLDTIDPNQMRLAPDFENISVGGHFLTILHTNGCLQQLPFNIDELSPLQIALSEGGLNELLFNISGGSGDYSVTVNSEPVSGTQSYFIDRTDRYEVRVEDSFGCVAIGVIDLDFIDIEIPNFFTPDGDGLNDLWKIKNSEGFPKLTAKIFDRYGRKLYFMGASDPGWTGFYQNKILPTGDYWYIIKINGESDTREWVGHFTLYR